MSRSHPYKWWNIITFIAVVLVNILASTLPIGGRSTAAVSNMYPTLITPAGYAFSIWSVIYVLLACFVVYQATPTGQSKTSVQSIGIFFILSCLFNIIWIFLWQYVYVELCVIVIILYLLSLSVVYVRTRTPQPTLGEMWFVKLPFSLNLGWVSVATIINIAVALEKNEWSGWGLSDTTWAIIFLLIGTALAIMVSFPYRDSIYPLVFVWAYVAIAVEHPNNENVRLAALILAAIILVYALWLFFARNRDRD
ncbi:tryptophan-rich sensory protein [Paenibacillus polymyxa]|uniref:tryptophan-rich sensory protein n=1 Tax=Paenibacillus polymyxa TaxID=1406 RepID=UPI002AB36123|nr:tryptophan-rich sensory protein [Paenibacillus polymyxa]MDY8048017.1 tryptophan-rich sensory protein [Paenibacillus polymyxa]